MAQKLQVGGVANDDGSLSFQAADGTTVLTITAAGALVMPNLPTSDPSSAGVLWANSDVVTVSSP